ENTSKGKIEIFCCLWLSSKKSLALKSLFLSRIQVFKRIFHNSAQSFKNETLWHRRKMDHFCCIFYNRLYIPESTHSGKSISLRYDICRIPADFLPCQNVLSSLPTHGGTILVPNQMRTMFTRSIHTSKHLNVLIPPHLWILLKPAQKLFAIILGRSVRKWRRALPANKQELFKVKVKKNKWRLLLSVGTVGIIFILFYFTHLEKNPITGRSLIEEFKDIMLPKEDLRYQLVQMIVDHLISCNGDLPGVSKIEWVVHVVQKSDINAFVLPNGQMFVFTGMLEAVANVHQLSFILGHELAHAILDHTFIFNRPFSRSLEAEADKVGLQLAAKAIKLREHCNCPALPSPDPRLVFNSKHFFTRHRGFNTRC
ncbi:hypothetical protein XELAEV_18023025mg, partial [Xenopus laevis]